MRRAYEAKTRKAKQEKRAAGVADAVDYYGVGHSMKVSIGAQQLSGACQ
jgi:hypothetical protein